MSGLGGWSYGFYSMGMDVPDDRVAAGVQAFKRALVDNGFGAGIDLAARGFGNAMRKQAVRFQRSAGIPADGVIGPETSRRLMRHYTFALEAAGTVEIPDHLLQRTGGLESDHDPVAQGFVDSEDEGWAQLHLPYFANVTLAQAWSPPFAAGKMSSRMKAFFVDDAADWDGAVASWNVGTGTAKAWVDAGKPASALVVDGVDYAARATHYVSLVKAQPA